MFQSLVRYRLYSTATVYHTRTVNRKCVDRRWTLHVGDDRHKHTDKDKDRGFVDEKAKQDYERAMAEIDARRFGYKIKRDQLPKPASRQRLRSVDPVMQAVASLNTDENEIKPLAHTSTPLPDLPTEGIARIAVAEIPERYMEEAVKIYRDYIGPAYLHTSGFKGGSLALDKDTRTMHSLTFWESQDAMDANNSSAGYIKAMDKFKALISKPPQVYSYQICCHVQSKNNTEI